MNYNKLFLDTSYVIAILLTSDPYCDKALKLSSEVEKVHEIWTHEGILLEVADWFAKKNRQYAHIWIDLVLSGETNIKVMPLDSELIKKGLNLYKKYKDKTIGITDCISFIVMWDKEITDALTTDNHFQQVGFKALLLE